MLTICVQGSWAQEFIHYNLTDGLSSVEVTDIKENENFIWIATTDGLNRFDGKHFKVFKHESENPNSLGENYIESLYFDSEGLLWIGLKSGGADIYDPKKEKFIHLNDVINAKVPIRVISILEDSQKNIWLGTWEEGVYKLTPVKGSKRLYTVEIHYPGYIVSTLIEKPSGYVRVGTYFGFFVYDMGGKSWIENEHQNVSVTQFLNIDEENEIWCSTWTAGIIKLSWNAAEPGKMFFKDHFQGEPYNSVFRMIGGNDGTIFLGTWGKGIRKFISYPSPVSGSIEHGSFSASLINALYRDKYNYIWVGTYGEGIFRFNDAETGLSHFPVDGSIPAPATSLASFSDDKVIMGTQGSGLYLFDLSENSLLPSWANTDQGDLKNYILALFTDDDYVLIGHDGFGLPYSVKEKQKKNLSLKTASFPSVEKITAFCHAGDGTIWIGTKQSGLNSLRINENSGLPEDYRHYDNFGRDEITGFADYNDTTLLIASHSGLFQFNPKTGRIASNGVLSTDLVNKVLHDPKNNCLWIGTSTNIMRLEYSDIQSRPRPAFPGYTLPQGAVRSMVSDKNNNFWFSIGEKLLCYLDKENEIREINQELLGKYAILSSAIMDWDNTEHLVLGTTDNLIIIDPEKIINLGNPSQIVLTELQIDHRKVNAGDEVFGTVVMDEASEYASSVTLSYKCRWISLQFVETGLDLFINRYQYFIKGFSDSWQYLDISNPITFSQLDPGKYTLQIRRYENETVAPVSWSMELNIIPPWWKTGWFTAIMVFVFVVLAFLSFSLIIRHTRNKQAAELRKIEREKEDELLREKESFFTGLSHDLMTPFSLIVSPANDLLREYKQEDGIREKLKIIGKNASFLSDIFGTILDFKRAELSDDDVKATQFEIVAFARMVVNAFDYLANSRNIRLSYSANVASLDVITDNVKIERILFNLISNALKFTPDNGKVEVKLMTADDNIISLAVSDNGSGMDIAKQSRVFEKFYRETEGEFHKKNKGLGLGLYIVRKFTDKLNGTITMRSAPGKGTEILVSVPVKVVSVIKDPEVPEVPEANHLSMEDKSTILVVEDNHELRDYIRGKLARHFNVHVAENGIEALTSIERIMPEILITDIMMPDMDGLTLTQRIKENSKYCDIFVVLLTAKISTDDELEGYRKGADLYIKKPFDGEVLLKQMINIHSTTQNRKNQIMSWLVSGEVHADMEFDSRDSFLKRSMQIIEEHIMEPGFRINEFASALNISKTVLHRKFRLLIGETPNQFIRLVRLRKSVHLLQHSDHSIAEIAYLTGFNQSHYFIKCFREVYNQTPGEFRVKVNG